LKAAKAGTAKAAFPSAPPLIARLRSIAPTRPLTTRSAVFTFRPVKPLSVLWGRKFRIVDPSSAFMALSLDVENYPVAGIGPRQAKCVHRGRIEANLPFPTRAGETDPAALPHPPSLAPALHPPP